MLQFQHGTCGDFTASFEKIDTDGNGELDRDEFAIAAKAIGMHISDEEISTLFETFDENHNGKISASEFSKFCVAEAKRKGVLVEVPLNTTEIVSFLGPKEASNGFKSALLALDANPAAALVPMPESDWLPIHCILMMGNIAATADSGHAKRAADKALMDTATPLLKKIVELKPECVAARVMPGVRYPNGQLPLFLALLRGWSFDVVKLLLDAYPDGGTTLDPISETKKGKLPGINKCRFARKIAEEAGAPPAYRRTRAPQQVAPSRLECTHAPPRRRCQRANPQHPPHSEEEEERDPVDLPQRARRRGRQEGEGGQEGQEISWTNAPAWGVGLCGTTAGAPRGRSEH